MSEAASLVAGAKKWATYYGDHANGDEGFVLTAPLRVRAAWDANDANAFADMFIENGSLLAGDNQLVSREEIRSYLAEAFGAVYQGSRLSFRPLTVRLLTETVAMVITQGGVVRAGENARSEVDEVRTMWVAVKRDGDWRIASYQTSPVKG